MSSATNIKSGALSSWLQKGTWSVLDQGLFAGANFLINVLLARWLDPSAYGAFTVAFAIFLLLGSLHGGMLVEPMLVFGSGKFKSRLGKYLRVLLSGHVLFALGCGLILGLLGLVFLVAGESLLGSTLLTLAWTQAFVLFLWMMRQACYVRLKPHWAAIAGAVYAVILLLGAFWLNGQEALTVTSALVLMAVGSFVAGAWLAVRLGIPLRSPQDSDLAKEAKSSHWTYGKWASATGGLQWLHGYLPFLILPIWAGIEESGALRALFNLIMPALHAFTALLLLLVPIFVAASKNGTLKSTFYKALGAVGVLGVGYGLVIGLFGDALMHELYHGKYDQYVTAIWLAAFLPPIVAVVNVAMALLRAVERPRDVFVARASAAGVASTIGVLLVRSLGFAGAVLSDVVSNLAEGIIMLRTLMREGIDGLVASSAPKKPRETSRRLKVLVSAYACQPGRGSEPGQGWAIARGLAEQHDVWLLTYPGYGFKNAIDKELAENPVAGMTVVYHQLGFEGKAHLEEGKDRSGLLEQLHYYRWQVTAARKVQELHREVGFDLTHHASHMKYWAPSALSHVDAPFVWGPVGGGESAPKQFYPAFNADGRRYERQRDFARALFTHLPGVRNTAQQSTLGLAATPETAVEMERIGTPVVEVVDPVALPDVEVERLGEFALPDIDGPLQLFSAGRFLHWKGYDYGLKAFAMAKKIAQSKGSNGLDGATYWLLGDGPESAYLKELAADLGIAEQVRFTGMVPRDELLRLLSQSHLFLHPSFHDCGGYATLEAMAAGRPVLCLNLGGPGTQVTSETGFAINAESPAQVVDDLADAIYSLAADRQMVQVMGRKGRERVQVRYRWDTIVADLARRHREIVFCEQTESQPGLRAPVQNPRRKTAPSVPTEGVA